MFVDTNRTQHFRVDVTDPSQDLVITVSPLYGDPDVYLSSESNKPGCYLVPSTGGALVASCFNYTWSSTASSVDVLRIDHTAPCTVRSSDAAQATVLCLIQGCGMGNCPSLPVGIVYLLRVTPAF